ncbi:hypothetical protein FN846DRAFT_903733 [Sphaerosporella brunnea]|uniref:Uncharacterized protein n=1 Tax=Sphaerosporella brunnea TaxID=1250544 RepID=A0A5J5F666_9PEZI|nr:hypothetical protein FN846DRAFT_903733 [Sphaerosporella brunnea]
MPQILAREDLVYGAGSQIHQVERETDSTIPEEHNTSTQSGFGPGSLSSPQRGGQAPAVLGETISTILEEHNTATEIVAPTPAAETDSTISEEHNTATQTVDGPRCACGPESDGQAPTPLKETYSTVQEKHSTATVDGPGSGISSLSSSGRDGQAPTYMEANDCTIQPEHNTVTVDGPGSSIPSFNPKTSILINFTDNIQPPMVVLRSKPFYKLYYQVEIVLGLNTDVNQLVAYVPGQHGVCDLTDKTWQQLMADASVQRLIVGVSRPDTW